MANLERGAYEPRVDNVRSFDLADEDEQEEIEEGSRLPLLIVIALLVLAAFGGVVWLAYTQGVQRGRADAPRLIAAEPGPIRIAPTNPGGTQTPYTGLKIYQQPAPGTTEATDSDEAPPSSQSGETATAVPSSPPPLRPSANSSQEAAANAVDQPPPLPATAKPVALPAASPPQAVPHARSVPSKEATVAPTPAADPATLPAEHIGSYVLQIGSYKSQSEADAAWQVFQAKHPIVGGYRSEVKHVDLGTKGSWYRLRLGSFADKTAAAAFCEKLRAAGGNCLLAK
jgi:cell division protein FtsN